MYTIAGGEPGKARRLELVERSYALKGGTILFGFVSRNTLALFGSVFRKPQAGSICFGGANRYCWYHSVCVCVSGFPASSGPNPE